MLGFNLFPAKVRQTEMAFYLKHLNQFGLPLDNRADYTKLDWEIWTATLADLRRTDALPRSSRPSATGSTRARPASRSPTGTTPRRQAAGFQARSVVGGVYIKALADKALAAKWRNRTEP